MIWSSLIHLIINTKKSQKLGYECQGQEAMSLFFICSCPIRLENLQATFLWFFEFGVCFSLKWKTAFLPREWNFIFTIIYAEALDWWIRTFVWESQFQVGCSKRGTWGHCHQIQENLKIWPQLTELKIFLQIKGELFTWKSFIDSGHSTSKAKC